MAPKHEWSGPGLSMCNACDLYRMKRSGSWAYAMSTRGPWERVAPVCEPIDRPFTFFEEGVERRFGWRARPILMVDVETTGLDWTRDSVIELGAVLGHLTPRGPRVEDGCGLVIDATFQTLIQPKIGSWVTEEITKLTGIRADDVLDAPSPEEAAYKFCDFVENAPADTILAAYNESFDHAFICGSLLNTTRIPPPSVLSARAPRLDPLVWSRKIDKYAKGGHKLTTIAARHDLLERLAGDARAHRADYDARLALEALAFFAPMVPDDLEELEDWQRAARGEWAANFFGQWRPKLRREERLKRLNDTASNDVLPEEEDREVLKEEVGS